MAKFKKLFEQSVREIPFSPLFDEAKHMEPEEVEFLENHETNPSTTNMSTPPAQVEWQWEDEDDFVYNCHLVKEVYDPDRRVYDIDDPDTPKRYNLRCWVYNKGNNMIGVVDEYCSVSEEFSEASNIDVLESFIQENEFLFENDMFDRKMYIFSRSSDF